MAQKRRSTPRRRGGKLCTPARRAGRAARRKANRNRR